MDIGGAYDGYVFATIGTDKLVVNTRLDALLNPLSIGVYSGKMGHFWICSFYRKTFIAQ